MNLSTIFSATDLKVLRALADLCFEEVTIKTRRGTVQLTWDDRDVQAIWRVETYLPDPEA